MRSQELQQWIDGKGSGQALVDSLASMPRALRQELFREAMRDNEILETYEALKTATGGDKGFLERVALEKYCLLPQCMGPVQLSLPGWYPPANAPSSNVIDTSAIFGVRAKRVPRPWLQDHPICGRDSCTILYTGEALYQFEWDVWHGMLTLGNGRCNENLRIKLGDLVDLLRLPDSGRSYLLLYRAFKRMSQASIFIQVATKGKAPAFDVGSKGGDLDPRGLNAATLYFIKDYQWLGVGVVCGVIDHRFLKLFGNSEYGTIPWDIRAKLSHNELAKKLQCFFAGQRENRQFIGVQKLLQRTGLTCDLTQFIRQLKKALNAMLEAGAIRAYWLSQPKRGELDKKLLYIWKTDLPSPADPVPAVRGEYFGPSNVIDVW